MLVRLYHYTKNNKGKITLDGQTRQINKKDQGEKPLQSFFRF
jgi:hypothetical protein